MAKEGSLDSFQRSRQSKGNQELNDELKLKANELEKLFAEHKLRTTTPRKSKHCYMQSWPSATSSFTSSVKDNAFDPHFENFMFMEPATCTSTMTKVVDENQSYVDVLDRTSSDERLISFADGSPGKFYEMYMQKRDAKLREEWNSNGAEKEAKLKAMEDSLERSRAEMKTNFAASADRDNNTVSTARRRAERLRSFNSSSILSRVQQQSTFGESDDTEDVPYFLKHKRNDELRSLNETSSGEEASKNTPRKKHSPIKISSTPRAIVTSVARSPMKVSSSPSSRRKSHPESPLARSVPNFSYMRKENADPSTPAGKTTRLQSRNYSQSKSTTVKLRSQSLRKSSPKVGKLKETSALTSDQAFMLAPLKFGKDKRESPEGVVFPPLKSGKDKLEQSFSDKYPKISISNTCIKKGKDADFSSRGGFTNTCGSITSKFVHDDEVDDDMDMDSEDSENRDEEDFENMTSAIQESFDNGTPRLRHKIEQLVNSGSENRDVLRSFSQVGFALEGVSPSSVPSSFLSGRFVQESPGESPVSWNSPAHHPSTYPHEMSDMDASDSPVGSPASLNSHFLSQKESEAARTRKKWGVAQKPIHVVNSSQSQLRKDKARGFKRLLSFGRKNRGTDSLVDWISTTTSKGDYWTGNGHDLPNRSSNHLRKPSDDSLYEDEFLNERVQSLHSSIPAPPANFKLREDHLSGSSIKEARERTQSRDKLFPRIKVPV